MVSQQSRTTEFAYAIGVRVGMLVRAIKRMHVRTSHFPGFSGIPKPLYIGLMTMVDLVLVGVAMSMLIAFAVIFFSLVILVKLPLSSAPDELPGIDDVQHPSHRTHFPERYDDYGSLR